MLVKEQKRWEARFEELKATRLLPLKEKTTRPRRSHQEISKSPADLVAEKERAETEMKIVTSHSPTMRDKEKRVANVSQSKKITFQASPVGQPADIADHEANLAKSLSKSPPKQSLPPLVEPFMKQSLRSTSPTRTQKTT
jgi:hypothetical protein